MNKNNIVLESNESHMPNSNSQVSQNVFLTQYVSGSKFCEPELAFAIIHSIVK